MWFHAGSFYNYIHHLERPLVTLEFQNVPKSALIFPSKPPTSTLRFSFKTYFLKKSSQSFSQSNIIVDRGRTIHHTWKKSLPFLEKVIVHFVCGIWPLVTIPPHATKWTWIGIMTKMYRQLYFKFRWVLEGWKWHSISSKSSTELPCNHNYHPK
jgi:hypothetical protein